MIAQARAFVTSVYGAIILALLAALIVQTVRIEGFKFWPLSIAGLKAELKAERDGRAADRLTYEQAQRDAKAKNRADVERIKTEQEAINEKVESDLNARLERLRRELQQKAAAPRSAAPGPTAGPDGKAPGGTDGSPNVCLTPSELLRAAENEERHDQLITWIEKQLAVPR